MQPIVLVGHRHDCPTHGMGTVVSGAPQANVEGRPIARVGDKLSCGAVIQSGSSTATVDGKAVARRGDTTSHGGVLIEGEPGWLVD
ncbi:PAAR domain-containing protein [Achromobacter sp. NPDC058515]|uniref:PAAR domain-containing protein n=1 Tax=Achromobacter sp. NPDC058515 TaxID=3346533 RepID=UPI0036549BC1